MQILIVDDEPAIRRRLVTLLSPFGSCETAVDGASGVRAVGAQLRSGKAYDLICLDVTMNGTDGIEALKAIRRLELEHLGPLERGAHIVMVTGLGQEEVWPRALFEGSSGYLAKPIHRAFLTHLLADLGVIERQHVARRAGPEGGVLLRELETRLRRRTARGEPSARDAVREYAEKAEHVLAWMSVALGTGEASMVARLADDLAQASSEMGAGSVGEVSVELGQTADAGDLHGCRALHAHLQQTIGALRAACGQESALRLARGGGTR